jgi:hypothetical protein
MPRGKMSRADRKPWLAKTGIKEPYKSAKKVHYKSTKNLPAFLRSNYYKNNKNII